MKVRTMEVYQICSKRCVSCAARSTYVVWGGVRSRYMCCSGGGSEDNGGLSHVIAGVCVVL